MLTDIVRLTEDMKSSMAKLEAVVSTKAGNEEDVNVKQKSLNTVKFNLYR